MVIENLHEGRLLSITEFLSTVKTVILMFNAYKEHRFQGAGEGREMMPTTVFENGDSKKLTGS